MPLHIVCAIALLFAVVPPPAAASDLATVSDEPFIVELAPDVFVRDLNGVHGANQVFVLFDTFVVVFDPSGVVEARKLLAEIRARTDKPIRYVVNSHFHPDHSAGAAVFAGIGAEVVAAAAARDAFEGWARQDFAAKILASPDDYRGLAYSPPTHYVDGLWALDDGEQRLELMHFGPGHTSGDLVGWLPRQRILLPGDLSTNGQHNLANADLTGWIGVLELLRALEPLQVVPGHRHLAGPQLLDLSHRYLFELRAQVRQMVKQGMTYDEVLASIDIPFYQEWSGVSVRNEPQHVARAYVEAGGTMEPPPAFISMRRIAMLLAFAAAALGLFATGRLSRRWEGA